VRRLERRLAGLERAIGPEGLEREGETALYDEVVRTKTDLWAINRPTFAEHLGLKPEPWQEHLLVSEAHRKILNCSRQAGKTTFVGLLALHKAIFCPGSLILIFSPSLRQSQEFYRKVGDHWAGLDLGFPADSERKLGLELPNGSRIEALPGSEPTIRGFSAPATIVLEEAAFIDDALYYSGARPMLATRPDAEIILISSPNGKVGFFHDIYTAGLPQWERYEIEAPGKPGTQHRPGSIWMEGGKVRAVSATVKAEYIEEERQEKSESQIRKEYYCEFLETDDAAFRSADVDRAFVNDFEPFMPVH
jgi:hypothetical protein